MAVPPPPPGFKVVSTGEDAPPPPPGFKLVQEKAKERGGNPRLEALKGAGEVLATLGSGAVLTPLAGIAGLVQGAATINKPGRAGRMTDRIKAVQDLTYAPKTEAGQAILGGAAIPFEMLARLAQSAGRATQDAGGGAVGGAAAETAVNMLPSLAGARGIPRAAAERGAARRAVADIERRAAEQGIDINATGTIQRDQLQDAAIRQTGGQQARGEPFPGIRERIVERGEADRQRVDSLYADARGTSAALPVQQAKELAGRVRATINERQFDVETMPILKRRLEELDKIEEMPEGSALKLNSLDAYRRRLHRNRAPATDGSQNLALDTVRREMDSFLDDAFDRDMIKGDPKALQKWKEARAASASYRERFKDDKIIRKFAEEDATPEQMRRWVFGASSVGALPQAAQVVRKIGDIVGRDSPEFAALRQDALFDIMEPLIRKEPSLSDFAKNYDRAVRNNASLVKELFPDSGRALRDLRAIAEAVERKAPDARMVDLNRVGAGALFGHGIHRAAIKMNIAAQVFARMRASGSAKEKRQIMGEVLGMDPDAPILPKRLVLLGTAGPTATGAIERQ